MLIVCEGEKTEKYYLEQLCRTLRLPGVQIVGRGAGPTAVWTRAQEEFARDQDFNRIACVFDRDNDPNYSLVLAEMHQQAASGWIGQRKAGGTALMAVPSDPCFEYWLLLHFQASTAAFNGPGEVVSRLRRCEGMTDYRKNQVDLFSRLRPRLETAMAHAKQMRQQAEATSAEGPLTEFDRLVEYLLEQGRRHEAVR